MRTTINMPDMLFQEAKARAVQIGMKFEDLVLQCIEVGLREKIVEAPIALREDVPLPVFRKVGDAPSQALSNAKLFEILERDEMV